MKVVKSWDGVTDNKVAQLIKAGLVKCPYSMSNTKTMTKATAKRIFLETAETNTVRTDKDSMRFSWGVFTDLLQRDGYITMKQYETWCCPF